MKNNFDHSLNKKEVRLNLCGGVYRNRTDYLVTASHAL